MACHFLIGFDPRVLQAYNSVMLGRSVAESGYEFVPGARMRATFEEVGPLSDWPAVAASWNDLVVDPYLAEGARFRKRRFAVYTADAGGRLDRQPHQPHFQHEARRDAPGEPTPEGIHRDGVDFVLVLLVNRDNIASGVTTVYDLAGSPLGAFTLTDPFDATLVDDNRVAHGVTPVAPLDPARPGCRDVLVVTFRRLPQ